MKKKYYFLKKASLFLIWFQLAFLLLWFFFEIANKVLTLVLDCRDPALISYYPDQQNARLSKEELPAAFGLNEKVEVLEMYSEFAQAGSAYSPFVETKHNPLEGKYYGVNTKDFRRTSKAMPWPPPRNSIFFLGGSTCFHTGPWWTGVAASFRSMLEKEKQDPEPVYNFGRSSYFSTQERILFEQLILNGQLPKAAIFLDGLNDLQIESGVPLASPFISSLYEKAIQENKNKYFGDHRKLFFSKITEAWQWSGPALLVNNLKNVFAKPKYRVSTSLTILKPDPTLAAPREKLQKAVERMIYNWKDIHRLGKIKGIQTIFVIQPVPVYCYDLQYHRFVPEKWPAAMSNVAEGYPLLVERCRQEKELSILDLSQMQKDVKENCYIDSCHYTAAFSSKIAKKIFEYYMMQLKGRLLE
ncbi:MAG: hypothetical protein KGQ54_05200 [Verrucomicrobia bacterium]|nr:hypothetical protein [Verrucomicrobiota bacterium]